jgi:hypothetical protein
MYVSARPWRRELVGFVLVVLSLASLPASAAEKPRFHVDDYQIDAVLNPQDHKLTARARVKITAQEELNVATFNLHNDLRLSKVTDEAGKNLTVDRVPQDSSVRVSLNKSVAKGNSATLTFEYEGVLDSADDSPVPGLKLTSINDDTTYLLYAGDWFPVSSFGIDRFTSTINLTVPAHMMVIGSGSVSPGTAPALKGASTGSGESKTYSLKYDKASFPGTIIAGDFGDYASTEAGIDLHVYFKPTHKELAAAYAETAVKEFTYFITLYGPPASNVLRVAELPDDTVPSTWAPEVAAMASRGITQRTNYRLLGNAIAHQLFGSPICGKRGWIKRTAGDGEGYVGRSAFLRHGSDVASRQTGFVFAGISVSRHR